MQLFHSLSKTFQEDVHCTIWMKDCNKLAWSFIDMSKSPLNGLAAQGHRTKFKNSAVSLPDQLELFKSLRKGCKGSKSSQAPNWSACWVPHCAAADDSNSG